MADCPSCHSQVPETSRFCSTCGSPLVGDEFAETRVGPAPGGAERAAGSRAPASSARGVPPSIHSAATRIRKLERTSAGAPSSDGIVEGRFIPGTMVAERYRIVGLLGRGGMGEVYRAEDLKLGQQVALKFLPESLAANQDRLDRFFNEVRIARQIGHPNVCRVFDIGDVDGLNYISMEYVDGEDLASLLRRIGRISNDKAVEIARQTCAGLAAAHDKGILHRDLKPANVMIDGRGKVRITDFGLAALAGEVQGAEVRVGTPAYMAPEQIAGREVSVQSDLYSLGLLLYESLTGKTVFTADTLADLVRAHTETMPGPPSSVVSDIDPALERVILRCLEKDPRDRPVSAMAVAAALPGGDPLAAALAAGETPSPEMVAAAGEIGALKPAIGIVCLASVVASFVALALLAPATTLVGKVRPERPPAVLEDRAREIIRKAGFTDPPADTAGRFGSDPDLLKWVKEKDPSPRRWEGLDREQPPAIVYWYRESPRVLNAANMLGIVTLDDPPLTVSGMREIQLDTSGRLAAFMSVPPQVDETKGPAPDPDWGALFTEAGLDLSKFTPVESKWTPLHYADARAAWEGEYPDRPGAKIRVEAASYRGRPVYFDVIGPWSRASRMFKFEQPRSIQIALVINVLLIVGVLSWAVFLARRNLRAGRGDRRGAFRIALFVLGLSMVTMLFEASHGADLQQEWSLFISGMGLSLFFSGILWLLYLALEPIVRRKSPDSIISWNRLLGGRLKDPLVGRDVLIGAAFGTASHVLARLHVLSPTWLGQAPGQPVVETLLGLHGARGAVVIFSNAVLSAMVTAMFLLFFYTTGKGFARDRWSPIVIFYLIMTAITYFARGSDNIAVDLPFVALIAASLTFVFVRYGLLAAIACQFFALFSVPLGGDLTTWYAPTSLLAAAAWIAVAAFAFYASMGGRPVFTAKAMEA